MQAVTLKIDDNVKDKFMWLINHFSKNEIEILESSSYKSDDEYLKSIKGMEQSIISASNEPTESYVTIDKLDW